MSSALFGTDGVRGIPGHPPLTPELVRRLAQTAGRILLGRGGRAARNNSSPFVVLGRDTRRTGPQLSRCLAEGFAAAGLRTRDVGIVPSPAVAYLSPRYGAVCGVVVSASHNAPEFNGIKFFTGAGFKAPLDLERGIEAKLPATSDTRAPDARLERDAAGVGRYLEFLRSTFPATRDLAGIRLVVDGSNGAASRIAPALFRGLGAEVFEVGCTPDGSNINVGCGALDTARMRREVVRRRAHCGVSFDGDCDRAIFSDERGRILDGDALIALSAQRLHAEGRLRGGKVVVTVMSNLGMVRYLRCLGIGAVEVPVGDRNVTDALEAGGWVLGGENSGHLVFRHLATTGDGLLTALQTLAAFAESGLPLSRMETAYAKFPQVLRNIRVDRRVPLDRLRGFRRELRRARGRLKGQGRVFVRYSGTEPLLRILVEGRAASATRSIAAGLERAFRTEIENIE